MKYLFSFILVLIFFASCQKTNTGTGEAPEISYLSVSGSPFKYADTASKVFINFYLKAKDLNFGNMENDSAVNIREYRSDTLYRSFNFPMPEIPQEVINPNYFEAFVNMPLKGIFFTPRMDSVHILAMKDTLYFEVFVKDDEGKESNVLKSDLVYIQRN